MNKILIIIKREYLTRVKKKSFLITTFLVPLLFAGLIFLPILLSQMKTSKSRIAVIDKSELIRYKLDNKENLVFKYVDHDLETMKKIYKDSNFQGVLYIPEIDVERPMGISFYSEKQLGVGTIGYIKSEINGILQQQRYEKAGIDMEELRQLQTDISIDTYLWSEEGEKSSSSLVSTVVSHIMGFVLYFSLLMYGTMVIRGVMEEKSNRIVELIMSSVKPVQLMFGKIFGIVGVALTQFTIWIITLFVLVSILGVVLAPYMPEDSQQMMQQQQMMQANPALTNAATALEQLDTLNVPQILFVFLFYFFGGYLFYSSLYAALGAAMDDDSDHQSMTLPVTLPIIVSFLIMINVFEDPSGPLAFWASLVPFSSPIIMPARVAFGVPVWQIVLSASILILSFIGVAWMAAKIYRIGILIYGKKVSFKEIFRWLKYR